MIIKPQDIDSDKLSAPVSQIEVKNSPSLSEMISSGLGFGKAVDVFGFESVVVKEM